MSVLVTTAIVPVPSAYTPIPLSPAEIVLVPVRFIFEPPFATIPIAFFDELESPTDMLLFIVDTVPFIANIPILSLPKAILPAFIFDDIPSRTIPVFFASVEVILFDIRPFVLPLIYTPIPSVPVRVILSFCIDVSMPL